MELLLTVNLGLYIIATQLHLTLVIESAAGLIKFGPWYHVAVSNAAGSGNLKLFLDGQQVASGTYGATSTQNGGVPRIAMGDYNNRNSQGFTGYISNLRLSNSTRYTGFLEDQISHLLMMQIQLCFV